MAPSAHTLFAPTGRHRLDHTRRTRIALRHASVEYVGSPRACIPYSVAWTMLRHGLAFTPMVPLATNTRFARDCARRWTVPMSIAAA